MSVSGYRSHPLERGAPPAWASAWGEDRYGVFAAFEVQGVEYRMRWIDRGEFLMGSPEHELGRDRDEVQHEVELDAFWIGEMLVTQALWQAAMRANPSHFKTPDRPVESVSWGDCKKFISALNGRKPGLDVWFPTEAQWERACRAGTTAATYGGDLKIIGENNAPILDSIAWYGGNSGRDFELDDGWDSSSLPYRHYPSDTRAGTRRVACKMPNAFGLCDTLGNVYEWCADWSGAYPRTRQRNPEGPDRGFERVLRGGAWDSSARCMRAAYRNALHPSLCHDNIGVRLARGP